MRSRITAAVFRERATGAAPVVLAKPIFTYGLQPNPAERGWAVHCGCDAHGDHGACTKDCWRYLGCGHPKGVMVVALTEDEADSRDGEPLADTDPLFTVTSGQVHAALTANPDIAKRTTPKDVVKLLRGLRIGVKKP